MQQNEISFCSIRNKQVKLNDTILFEVDSSLSSSSFLMEVYKFLELKYKRFHKMDELCKYAIIASSLLLKDQEIHEENTALLLSNACGSTPTDVKYIDYSFPQEGQEQFVNNPATFVYTLPSVMMGELSILFGFNSENQFMILPTFQPDTLLIHAHLLLVSNMDIKHILCGWINIDEGGEDVFLFLLERDVVLSKDLNLLGQKIKDIYQAQMNQ